MFCQSAFLFCPVQHVTINCASKNKNIHHRFSIHDSFCYLPSSSTAFTDNTDSVTSHNWKSACQLEHILLLSEMMQCSVAVKYILSSVFLHVSRPSGLFKPHWRVTRQILLHCLWLELFPCVCIVKSKCQRPVQNVHTLYDTTFFPPPAEKWHLAQPLNVFASAHSSHTV